MAVSGRGYGVLIAGIVLLAGGFWFGYPELAALGAACLAAVTGAVIFVSWRPQLEVDRIADPDRVSRGESSRLTLRIGNASRFLGASVVARDILGGAKNSGGGIGVPVPLLRLRPGRTTEVGYPVPTRRRGVLDVGPLEITRRDPLGLVGVVRRYGS